VLVLDDGVWRGKEGEREREREREKWCLFLAYNSAAELES